MGNELYKLQKSFLSFLTEGDKSIKPSIIGTEKVNADTRLSIYSNAYSLRLVDALSDSYPAVHTLIGDEGFYELGMDYVKNHPSRHFSIRYFGNKLAEFLAQYNHNNSQLLSEMAQFEWRLRDSFDSADTPPISLDALQNIDPDSWGDMRFVLHPSVSRLDLKWNAPQLWLAIENEEDPIPPEEMKYPVSWLIWRQELRTLFRSVEVDEGWALDAIMNGQSFGDICGGLCEWIDEINAAPRAAGFLNQWLTDGLVVGIK